MTDISIETAPRDFEGLKALKRATRYRIAYQLQLFADNDAEMAFAGGSEDVQAHAVAAALQQLDANQGALQQPTMPQTALPAMAPPQPMAMQPSQPTMPTIPQMVMPQGPVHPPQAAPQSVGQHGMPVTPQHVAPPYVPQTAPVPPPQQGMPSLPQMNNGQPYQQVQTSTARQPQTTADPNNTGSRLPASIAENETWERLLRRLNDLSKKQQAVGEKHEEWFSEIYEQLNAIKHFIDVSIRLQVYLGTERLQISGEMLAKMMLQDDDETKAFLSAIPIDEEEEEEEGN